MNFKDTEKSIMLVLASGRTPVVVGERGIGKTAMMKSIAENLDMHLINIDCNLLKEGTLAI